MAAIVLKNVSRIYPGGFRAVDDISLEIQDQEFVVLVGPAMLILWRDLTSMN